MIPPNDSPAAAKLITQAASADGDASKKMRDALGKMQASLNALRLIVKIQAVVIVVLTVAVVVVGTIGIVNARNTVSLCGLQNDARAAAATLKRQRADLVVPGPDYASRRGSLIAEAGALEHSIAVSRCKQRFQIHLP